MIGARRPGSPVDGEGDPVARRRNAFARHLGRPPEAGLRPQLGSSTAGSGPSAATTQHRGPNGSRRDWRLPATQSSVSVLRRGLNSVLARPAWPTTSATTSPGRLRGREPFVEVLAEIGGTGVTIIVCDHGQWRDATPGTYRGRGLAMVRVLVDTTIDAGAQGTTVTLRCHRPAAWAPGHAHPQREAADGSPIPSSAVAGP